MEQQQEALLIPTKAKGLDAMLRQWVQLDYPVPTQNKAEIAAKVEEYYSWNFVVNIIESAWFKFGASFASASTILPLFISKLTPNPIIPIGLVAVLAQGGWFLPQLFAARVVERLPLQKPLIIRVGFFLERLPYWLVALSPLLAVQNPTLALTFFLIAYAWHILGNGAIAAPWQELIARGFPVNRRGRFFGLNNFISGATGILAAALSARLLASFSFPQNFLYLFTIAAIALMMSWLFLSLNREVPRPVETPQQSQGEFLQKLPQILKTDHNFRKFLIARLLMALGGMGGGFITAAAINRWQISDSTVGIYTTAMLIGETLGHLAFGFTADRFGHKVGLVAGALITALSYIIAWLAPSPAWYFVAFLFQGISISAIITAGIMIVMEFGRPEQRPTYVGLVNTSVGVIAMIAPLLGTLVAGVSYAALFAISAGISLISFAMLCYAVREPRWTSVQD